MLSPEDGGRSIPLPVILDANLKFRSDSKLMRNFKEGKGRQPTIFTSANLFGKDVGFEERRRALESDGIKIIPITCDDDGELRYRSNLSKWTDRLFEGKLDLKFLLNDLQAIGVRSLMVEGGASIISSFLQSGLVNSLIVTVCPTIVGNEGVGYDVKGQVSASLISTCNFADPLTPS